MWFGIRYAIANVCLGELRVRPGRCPLCGRTLFLKFAASEHAVRCLRCGASVIGLAMGTVLAELFDSLDGIRVYELSTRGALIRHLRAAAADLTCSDYFDDVAPGDFKGSIQCQDVQQLTYDDESFDLCTCTEVFEHVPDDRRGMSEVHRVLRPGGVFLFTVPLHDTPATVERAIVRSGSVIHVHDPEYHNDYVRGFGSALCFRDYGLDIVDRLREAGFTEAHIEVPADPTGWGYTRPVVVARKLP